MESEVKPSTDSLLFLQNLTPDTHSKFKTHFLVFENTITYSAVNTAQREKASAPRALMLEGDELQQYNGKHTCTNILYVNTFGIWHHKLYRK